MTRVMMCLGCLLVVNARVSAQGKPPGTVNTSLAITGVHQFDSDLERGGHVGFSTGTVSAGVMRQFVPAFAAGISARYVGEDWRAETPAAPTDQVPWRNLSRSNVGLNLSLALSKSLLVGLSPVVEWAMESGANSSDALTYGAVVSVVKVVNGDLVLGAGASINRQFYSVKVSPFLIINWKVNDRFRIANALPAGPEGGAGIEARFTLSPDWELAGGGVIRSDRYRLANDGVYAGLIGETASMPFFARLSRQLGPDFKLDLYAGALASPILRIKSNDGAEVTHSTYATAPAVAVTVSFKR